MWMPKSYECYERSVFRMTAKMSFPSRMRDYISNGGKMAFQKAVADELYKDIRKLKKVESQSKFKNHHKKLAKAIARRMQEKFSGKGNKEAVARKLLDTFLHQLTKEPGFHHLRPVLYLPLDSVIMNQLRRLGVELEIDPPDCDGLVKQLKRGRDRLRSETSAYKLSENQYYAVQDFTDTIIKKIVDEYDPFGEDRSTLILNAAWAK